MRRFKKSIIHIKIYKMIFLIFVLFSFLIFRLAYIQIFKHDEYKNAANTQRVKEVKLKPQRGLIYDKNLIPLTNTYRVPMMFIFKQYALQDEYTMNFITQHTGLSKNEIMKGKDIIEIPINDCKIDEEKLKGVLITDKTLRYNENNVLSHVIGYIKESENKGESGIEKVFDDILNEGDDVAYFELDGKRRIIPGGGYRCIDKSKISKPNCVKLTIDYHIQKIVEEVIDEQEKNGSIIVSDVDTGDIVAMVSRPNFDSNNISSFVEKDKMEFYNKAIQVSYPPGSLFKIVVLLAALENDEDIMNETFYCKGYEQLDDTIIKCSREEGHGELSVKEAFTKSCNSTFIQIGKRIGSESIIEMAKKLGFGQKMNIGLLEEVSGNLPKRQELLGPSIGNISIGQGNIEATPLQITNMMMIVANNGIKKGLSIVDGIVSESGYMAKKFRKEEDVRVVSENSCNILKDCMKQVVLNGTARNLKLEDIGGASGKTGSAEAILNKKETVHGWFAGFFPRENPKYVITVLVEQGNSGSKSAVPIFEKISRKIYKIKK